MKTGAIIECVGVRWRELGPGELTYHLSHSGRDWQRLYFEIESEFVPEAADPSEGPDLSGRTACLLVSGCLPHYGNWAALEHSSLSFTPGLYIDDEEIVPPLHEPEVDFWSHDEGEDVETYARHCWDARVSFGTIDRQTLEIPYRVEAFVPSDDTRQAYSDFLDLWWTQPPGTGNPWDEFAASGRKRGWHLDFEGTVCLTGFLCSVPINSRDATGYAKHLVTRELDYRNSMNAWVVGSRDWDHGSYAPDDGIGPDGRMVKVWIG